MPCFWECPSSRMMEWKSKVALVLEDGSSVGYDQLGRMVSHWKNILLEQASGERCFVVLEFDTSAEAIAAYLGALDAALPLAVVEPGHAGPDTPLARVYTPEIFIRRPAPDASLEVQPVAVSGQPPALAHPDLRLLLSTSGSTGDPKLVRLSGENIQSNAEAIADYLGITSADRAMLTLPLFYSYGLSVLNSYLARGATLILNDRSVVDAEFWTQARAAGATSLALVPHQFDLLEGARFLTEAPSLLPSLRYVTQAGGRLDPATARRFDAAGKAQGWDLVLMYGQTEAAPRISWVPPEALPEAADTIGRAIPGGKLWLADEDGAEITRPGVSGELVYEGPNVMMGYATARADFSLGQGSAQLRTGDIAEFTPDGMFRIVGRKKRFVKLYGLRLSLDQIEKLLGSEGFEIEAVAAEDRLVLLHRAPGCGPRVRQLVAEEYGLPEFTVHVAHLDKLPLLSSGKTDRQALARIAADMLAQEAAPQAGAAGKSLAEVLAWATRSADVGPGDSFTSLGGDSLSYLQVQLALEDRLGEAPPGWEDMSVLELEALRPGDTEQTQSRWGKVGMDVVLRLAAICLVVAQHASDYPLYGGTWILILLMGYSAARFQLPLLREGQVGRVTAKLLYPIIPFYFLILLSYNLLRDGVPWEYYLLLGNFYTWREGGSLLTIYWFVSLYAQIVLVMVLAGVVPVLRRRLAAAPFTTALALAVLLQGGLTVAAMSGLYAEGEGLWPVPYVASHGIAECLPLFLVGWMIQLRSRPWHTAAIAVIALWGTGGFLWLGSPFYVIALMLIAPSALMAMPALAMPQRLRRLLQQAARLTLFVYLLHPVVVHGILYSGWMDLPQWAGIPLAIGLSFLLAVMANAIFIAIDRWMLTALRPLGVLRRSS